ncbi:MAG: GNAT family N-acetyltransferase [Candidatus Pacebacteria bacterium]|nr:GNAT family N-acetyltransferase [Candidatus Paceibacterota bacterium]
MDYIIHIATKDEWKALKDIWLEALQNDPAAYGSSYEEESALTDEEWKSKFDGSTKYVAKIGDEYIGVLGATFEKRKNMEHVVMLVGFYVKPNYRGQGIGRALVKEALRDLHENPKIIKVRLGVNLEQESAIKLYESLGFANVGMFLKATKVNGVYYDHANMELVFQDKL